jgi:hypothetical protein
MTGAAGGVCHSLGSSHQLAGGDGGEVDVGLADYIDVVRPGVERDMEDDFDHLCIVVAGRLYGIDTSVTWPCSRTTLTAKRTAASALGSFEAPLRLAVISASSSLARFLPR